MRFRYESYARDGLLASLRRHATAIVSFCGRCRRRRGAFGAYALPSAFAIAA